MKNRDEYIVSVTRPCNLSEGEMVRLIKEAVQKIDTRHKTFTKEVITMRNVSVRCIPLPDCLGVTHGA